MGRIPGEQFGDYRLVRLLGEGGFAEVYEADHMHLPGVKAAIKLLKGSFTSQQVEALRREALMVSKLDHPHIVPLRTFSVERGLPYLVMAYAQGGTLKQRYPRGIRMTLPEILGYMRPIADALQYAHTQKIVHRDLKPANLLLTQDGRVQVADFGIAVVAHHSYSRTIQEIAGTWMYMAPEQFRGLAGPASDQYSMAIIVYQWLCGDVPFDGRGNMYLIPQQQKEELPPSFHAKLPDLSLGIEVVVTKALAKDPKERFASIQEFVEALEEASRPPFVPTLGQCLGDYRLIRKLGEGGFAEVYEAEHVHLGTKAAIKLLKGIFTSTHVEGLRQEARSILQLDHSHIIRAYGFSIADHVPYLVMAYAPGGSLAARHERGVPLALDVICEYVQQVAAALHYAHTQHITHRDIKPENILLAQDGRVQVADFGIAVMAQGTQTDQEVVGSWTYMAPEQFEGKAEPASDQYALGIMVYEWLCGEPPFTGNGSIYALPYQHMNEPPPSLCQKVSTISPDIEQVVMKALSKDSKERFADIQEFSTAFLDVSKKLLFPDHPAPSEIMQHKLLAEGDAYFDAREAEKALFAYNKVIALDPNTASAYGKRGILFCSLQDYPRGFHDFDLAIQLDLSNDKVSLQTIENAIKIGNLTDVTQKCLLLLKYFPESLEVQRLLGEIYLQQDKLDEAQHIFEWILTNDPENVIVYCDYGLMSERMSDVETALDCYQQAYELSHGNTTIRQKFNELSASAGRAEFMFSRAGLARLYMRGELFMPAIQEWEAVLSMNPDRLDARIGLMETHWREGSYDQAEYIATRLLEEIPTCLKALLLLADITARNNVAHAIELFSRARDLDPEMFLARDLFRKKGSYVGSLSLFCQMGVYSGEKHCFWKG